MPHRPSLSAPVTVVVTPRHSSFSGPRSANDVGRNFAGEASQVREKRTVRVMRTVRPALLSRVATRLDVRASGPDVTERWRTRLYGACKQLRNFAAEIAVRAVRASGSNPKFRMN